MKRNLVLRKYGYKSLYKRKIIQIGYTAWLYDVVYMSLIRNTADKIQIQKKQEHKIQDTMMKIV